MAGRYGTIPSNLSIGASQSVRRNSGDSAFETFTPFVLPADPNADKILFWDDSAGSAEWLTLGTGLSITGTTINAATGITIGSTPISAGTNDRILFQSGGVVSQDADLTFDGTNLVLGNAGKHLEIGLDSSYNAVFGHAYAVGDNVAQHQFKYFRSGSYGSHGLALVDTGHGYTTVLDQLSSGTLYWTNAAGSPGSLSVGAWNNPSDGNNLRARFGAWDMPNGDALAVNAAWAGVAWLEVTGTTEQARIRYDASNYESTTISSTGVVTRNAVGSGAKFVFSDAVEVPNNAYGSGWNASLKVPTEGSLYTHFSNMGWAKNNQALGSPTTGDDNTQGYDVGSMWLDLSGGKAYACFDASTGAADWQLLN